MTLIMISGRMFMELCWAQARARKEEPALEPQRDGMTFSGARGDPPAASAQNIGHEPVGRRKAQPVSGSCVGAASLRIRESGGERA